MRILALEPYHGGSHAAFLDGWRTTSAHQFTTLTMAARKWKWRMRHAALHFAREAAALAAAGQSWDALWCSDMLDLATFRGLAPPAVAALPAVVYFHENQLGYPVQVELERDLHFAYTNMTTALAADAVWFNSAFNRDGFLDELPQFLKRMPDHQPTGVVAQIRAKARIEPPGIEPPPRRGERRPGPPRIAWAARWEHDKNPETFFEALRRLRQRGVACRVSVLGERFERCPPVFDHAEAEFAGIADHWGFLPDRDAYGAALAAADIFVSTARHEFFGLSVMEAIAAGCHPLLPRRLVYPELLTSLGLDPSRQAACLYAGSGDDDEAEALAAALVQAIATRVDLSAAARERYAWAPRAAALDTALADVVRAGTAR